MMIPDAILISIIVIGLCSLIFIVIGTAIMSIKDNLFPPCKECMHCIVEESCLNIKFYNCNRNKDKICGIPRNCSNTRGSMKCWFKKKQ